MEKKIWIQIHRDLDINQSDSYQKCELEWNYLISLSPTEYAYILYMKKMASKKVAMKIKWCNICKAYDT